MNLVVPYTDLRPQTKRAALRATAEPSFIDTSHDREAYWELLRVLWRRSETFILLEHDIVPHAGALQELLDCPRDWCAFAYQCEDIVLTAFGCTKFSGDLLDRQPDIVLRILPQHRFWNGLDAQVIGELRRRGEVEHEHGPAVKHLQVWKPQMSPEYQRRRNAMKLIYVGDGRQYINAIPARDFDTDDPTVIAECLASGLYINEDDAKPRSRKDKPAETPPPPAPPAAPLATTEPEPAVATDTETVSN